MATTSWLIAVGLVTAMAPVAASANTPPAPPVVSTAANESGALKVKLTKLGMLDRKLIKAMVSKDHTVVVGDIKIKTIVAPNPVIFASMKTTTTIPVTWTVRDSRASAVRARVCFTHPQPGAKKCVVLPLTATKATRNGVDIRRVAKGWQIQAVTTVPRQLPKQCRAAGSRGVAAGVTLGLIDADRSGKGIASDSVAWRMRCGR